MSSGHTPRKQKSIPRAQRASKSGRSLSDVQDPGELIARLRELSRPLSPEEARAVRDRGAQLVASDPATAHRLSEALLQAAERAPEPVLLAVAWRARAESSLFSGLYPQSREAYQQAVTCAREAGDGGLEGQILVGYMHVLSLLGAGAQAQTLGARADGLLKRAGDLFYLSKLHVSRGNVFYQSDRYADAYDAYRQAERAFTKLGIRDASWASVRINQAIACTNLARIRKAREIFEEVQAFCDQEGLSVLSANARYNRCFLEALRGDYRLALSLLDEASPVFAANQVVDMVAACMRTRAEIYLDLNLLPEAREWAQRAAAEFAAQDMAFDQALARLLEARTLQAAGELTEAASILHDVTQFFQQQGNRPRQAAAMLAEAEVAASRGDLTAAIRGAGAARRVFERLKLKPSQLLCERRLARFHIDAGHLARAEKALAPQMAQTKPLTVGARMELMHLAGRLAARRKETTSARRRYLRAAEYLEIQRQLTPGLELRSRAFEKQVRIYHDLIAHELEHGARAAHLLAWMEAARARTFRERRFLRGGEPKASTIEARAALGSLIRRLHEAEFPEDGPPDLELVARLRGEIATIEKQAAEDARRALDVRSLRPGSTDLLPVVAGQLAADEALIEYFVLGPRIVVLVVHGGRTHQWILPASTEEVAGQLARVRFQLDSMALTTAGTGIDEAHLAFHRGAAEDALAGLYRCLVEPLIGQLPVPGRWLIVPHQRLHLVPFEGMPAGEGPLIDQVRIVRCPAAEVLRGRPRRAPGKGKKTRALICGTHHTGLDAIASELEAVAAAFPKSRRRVLEDPTSEELLRRLPSFDVVHLTAHGVFREDNPNFSYLSTRDGALFLMDLYGRRIRAEMVTLSACRSGQAFTGQGDDLAGVAHGFLSAGARQLVASQWRVHDEATRDFMEAFYRHYGGSAAADPARALSAAAAEIRPRWNHPFFWSAFGVYGC